MKQVHLGDVARDRISGFRGVVTARTEWLYGCIRVALAPTLLKESGELREAEWFDENQVDVVERSYERPREDQVPSAGTGGPPRAHGGRPVDPGAP